ncbi:MAG: hypothetical protein AAGJ29_02975 [Pseudomonadota bacterium]
MTTIDLEPAQSAREFSLPCTIIVNHTWESLEAHVELDGGVQPEIGDKITVHGPRITVPFGESARLRRLATVRKSGPIERLWIRIAAFFELTELYEVSFSTGRIK